MRVAIHQPNYAPWCGYFAKLAAAQVFVLLDDAQMPSGRSYVSRTRLLGASGPQWLSVPVHHHAQERICDVRFAEPSWARRHLATWQARYARAPFFAPIFERLQSLYAQPGERLADFNERLVRLLAEVLGLTTPIVRASELSVAATGDARMVALCKAVGGTEYLSGPSGPRYQHETSFVAAGLRLQVRAYEPLAYPQGGPFIPGLSMLDALFRLGPAARELLRYPDLVK